MEGPSQPALLWNHGTDASLSSVGTEEGGAKSGRIQTCHLVGSLLVSRVQERDWIVGSLEAVYFFVQGKVKAKNTYTHT